MNDTDIKNLVCGDDFDLIRDINSVPVTQFITDAWMTVKEDFWSDAAVIQKHITDSISSDGIIEDTGAGDSTGRIIFTLLHDETVLLNPFFKYAFDIQIKTNADKIFTLETGTLTATAQVTTEV